MSGLKEDMLAILPLQKTQMRACLLCSLIRNYAQFKTEGCTNCEELLHMARSTDKVNSCTTPKFTGMIVITDIRSSWVAKWQRVRKCKPGLYAIQVEGRIPDEVEYRLQRMGVDYRPRDGSMDMEVEEKDNI